MPDHLGISTTEARAAIITGNPERVPLIASSLQDSRFLTEQRGFVCYEGLWESNPLLVVSTGIGAPSTAIVVEELIELGVQAIIRIGTCGALQSFIQPGDIIISTGCVRDEGTTAQYIDPIFPAVPDHVTLSELLRAASQQGHTYHVGITHSKDSYYMERRHKQVDPEGVHRRWVRWKSAGVLVTEMEASALFVLGSLRAIRTGAVLISVGRDPIVSDQALQAAAVITLQSLSQLLTQTPLATLPAQKSIVRDDEPRSFL